MRYLLILLLLSFAIVGCEPKSVVRDPKVYQLEIQWYTRTALEAADLMDPILKAHCLCNGGTFDGHCLKIAKYIVRNRARAAHHGDMMLYNGSLLDKRPGAAPEVPKPSSLCPGVK